MEDRLVWFGNVVCGSGRKVAESDRGFFPLSVLSAAERGFCPFLSLCPKSSRAAVALRLPCGLFLILFLGKDYFPGFVHIVVEYYLFFKIETVSSIVGRGVVSH